MNKKPTLKDIAQLCHCSITSASRALKNSPTISLELRKRVQETASRLGYIPNSLATSMRTGSTNTIAAILQDFRNPFFAVFAKYIEEYARDQGYTTLIITTNESAKKEYEACMTALGKNVDGLLLFPVQKDDKSVLLLNEQHIPYVLVGRCFQEIDTNTVLTDDEQGAYLITKHLIEKGATHILFLNSYRYIYSSRAREKGFQRALEHSTVMGDIVETSMDFGNTRNTLKGYLKDGHTYDAIITFCDLMGFEAYNTLHKMGLSIPEDILLASMDGLQQDIIFPVELTSAGTDRKEMTRHAIDLLLELISHKQAGKEKQESKKIILPQFLIQGETT